MSTKKIRVGILFGGKSAEHEVSLQSAKNVIAAFDKSKFDIVEILIPKDGQIDFATIKQVDAIFPVLHGTFGEDGTIQGMLEMLDVPYVGAGVLGSAVGMDKDVAKRLMRDAGIPVAKFVVMYRSDEFRSDEIESELGWPMFIKPARSGSSVGVSKAKNSVELEAGIRNAFKYDSKILIEEYVAGQEIECSVMGNDEPIASLPGRVIPNHEFYSYTAKYIDEKGATIEIPAKLTEDLIKKVQTTALATYRALCLEGMARVDMFLKKDGHIVLNEVNTIPGFTNISMYPKLWEVSGLSYTDLISKLIDLAMERHQKRKKLITNFEL